MKFRYPSSHACPAISVARFDIQSGGAEPLQSGNKQLANTSSAGGRVNDRQVFAAHSELFDRTAVEGIADLVCEVVALYLH
jgi:hypothetical protein